MFPVPVSSESQGINNMSKKLKILAALVLILVAGAGFLLGRKSGQSVISVDLAQQNYEKGEQVELTIRNNTSEQICFSSCFPYYLQRRKNDKWVTYDYPSCSDEDLSTSCISPSQVKKFRLTLEKYVRANSHRFAIPIFKGGEKGEKFEETERIYSEPFEVK